MKTHRNSSNSIYKKKKDSTYLHSDKLKKSRHHEKYKNKSDDNQKSELNVQLIQFCVKFNDYSVVDCGALEVKLT